MQTSQTIQYTPDSWFTYFQVSKPLCDMASVLETPRLTQRIFEDETFQYIPALRFIYNSASQTTYQIHAATIP